MITLNEGTGQGTITYPDGSVYEGSVDIELVDDIPITKIGQGTLTTADGNITEGIWEFDTFVK